MFFDDDSRVMMEYARAVAEREFSGGYERNKLPCIASRDVT